MCISPHAMGVKQFSRKENIMATTMEQMQKAMAKAEKAKTKGKITTEKEEPVVARTIEAEVMCGEIIPMPDFTTLAEKFSGWTAKWISGVGDSGEYRFCRVQFIWRNLEDFANGIPFVNVYEGKEGNLYVGKVKSEWKDSYTGEVRKSSKEGLRNFFLKGGKLLSKRAFEYVEFVLIEEGLIR